MINFIVKITNLLTIFVYTTHYNLAPVGEKSPVKFLSKILTQNTKWKNNHADCPTSGDTLSTYFVD